LVALLPQRASQLAKIFASFFKKKRFLAAPRHIHVKRNLPLLLALAAFVASLLLMPHTQSLFAWAFPGTQPAVYDRGTFVALAASHLALVAIAVGAATVCGTAAAIVVTRPWGQAAAPLVGLVAKIGQSFPPAAVLAVMVPMLGFGALPTLVALFAYGLLPVVENMQAGLRGVPETVREAATAIGFSPLRRLLLVELPLAWPQGLAGIRTAAVVGLGTATVGSTVGALTLGTPIIDGLVANKPGFVLQGAIPLALLAVVFELAARDKKESASF
jgi:osmoprotectant transport system permease protein